MKMLIVMIFFASPILADGAFGNSNYNAQLRQADALERQQHQQMMQAMEQRERYEQQQRYDRQERDRNSFKGDQYDYGYQNRW